MASKNIRFKCPKCGYVMKEQDWRCPECYCEFNNFDFNKNQLKGSPKAKKPYIKNSISILIEKIKEKDILFLDKIGPKDSEAVPTLIKELKSSQGFLQYKIVIALRNIGPAAKTAVSTLIKAIKDEDENVQIAAIEALGEICDSRACAHLANVIDSPYSTGDIRWYATVALGKLGKCAVPALIKAIRKDDYYRVRMNAAEALGRIGDLSAVPVLKFSLNDNDEDVRRAASQALNRFENC